jgi:MFS family permease
MAEKTVGADLPSLPRGLGWALGSGTILQGLNSSIIAVALVSIGVYFGDSSNLPWLVSGLYIACAVASPAAGRLVDLFGARRMYLAGLVVVLVAALAGPFMPSVEWLIVDRIVLGVGASMHFPAAMAIIRRQAEVRAASGRASLGIIALCGQTTAAIGPSIGGVIVLLGGWQGIFWVNLPIVINSAIWVLVTVPRDVPREGRRSAGRVLALLDPLGLVLFVVALVLTMMGLLELASVAEGDIISLLLLLASVPVWAVFVIRELRAATPFLDVRLLGRYRDLTATCGRAIVTFLAFYCVFYGLPQWFETGRGLSPAGAGLLMFPVFGVGVLSTIVATNVGKRMTPRLMLVIGSSGFLIAGLAMVFFLTGDAPYWLMILLGAALGVPNGFNNIGNQLILQRSVPADTSGVASGLYRTAQYVGAALSSVVVALVLAPEQGAGGIHLLGMCIAVIGLALLLMSVVAIVRGRASSLA